MDRIEIDKFKPNNDVKFNIHIPTPNFEMEMGDLSGLSIIWSYYVEYTIKNRIKYWFFFRIFPFRLRRWDKK